MKSILDKIEGKSIPEPNSGCWIWFGATSRSGYALIFKKGEKTQIAQRLLWAELHGKIPKGIIICHKCNNKSCVNPGHLYAGTPKSNSHDFWKSDRLISQGARNKLKKQIKDSKWRYC